MLGGGGYAAADRGKSSPLPFSTEKSMLKLARKLMGRVPEQAPAVDLIRPDITPDMWRLGQYKWQHLFVMGDENERDLAVEASFTQLPEHPTCYTEAPFTLWKKDLGKESYPIPLPETYRPTGYVRWPVEPARIRGELWKIHPEQFILLDSHKQNGIQFRRQRIKIILPAAEVAWRGKNGYPTLGDFHVRAIIPAWAYLGIEDYWDAQIGGVFAGAQLELREGNRKYAKQFYQFQNR